VRIGDGINVMKQEKENMPALFWSHYEADGGTSKRKEDKQTTKPFPLKR